MNRHNEVTSRFKRLKEKHIDRLNALDERMDKHETKSSEVFDKFEGTIEHSEREMREMERDVEEMAGNGGEGGETDDNVSKFPNTGAKVG